MTDQGLHATAALVTGHSRGLGAAIAADLLARGVAVLGISRARHPDLARRFPDLFRDVTLDLSDLPALGAWLAGPELAEFLAGCRTILLINNAGTLQPMGPLSRQEPAAVADAIALNVAAPLALSAGFVRATPSASDRRILHISSGAGRNAYPGWSVYCAGKAALDHHARAVAADNLPNLRICSLAPGVIATEMQAEIRASDLADFPLRERFDAMHRDGQLLDPADVAARIVEYLLDARYGSEPVASLKA